MRCVQGFVPWIDQASVAAGAVCEGADRERLSGVLELDVELVAYAIDLVDTQPIKGHLHPHAVYTADRSWFDDACDSVAVSKLELFAIGCDKKVALSREGHLQCASITKRVGLHTLWEEAPWQAVLLQHVIYRGGCIHRDRCCGWCAAAPKVAWRLEARRGRGGRNAAWPRLLPWNQMASGIE